jgi:hypothetical protein
MGATHDSCESGGFGRKNGKRFEPRVVWWQSYLGSPRQGCIARWSNADTDSNADTNADADSDADADADANADPNADADANADPNTDADADANADADADANTDSNTDAVANTNAVAFAIAGQSDRRCENIRALALSRLLKS